MTIWCYAIDPTPAPRQVQSDAWNARPPVQRYRVFRDLVKLNKVNLPAAFRHVIFVLPMPASWEPRQKAQARGWPHQQRPDRDNLEKALLDSVYTCDAHLWDGRTTKLWGDHGMIVVSDVSLDLQLPVDLSAWWAQAQRETRAKSLPNVRRRTAIANKLVRANHGDSLEDWFKVIQRK